MRAHLRDPLLVVHAAHRQRLASIVDDAIGAVAAAHAVAVVAALRARLAMHHETVHVRLVVRVELLLAHVALGGRLSERTIAQRLERSVALGRGLIAVTREHLAVTVHRALLRTHRFQSHDVGILFRRRSRRLAARPRLLRKYPALLLLVRLRLCRRRRRRLALPLVLELRLGLPLALLLD